MVKKTLVVKRNGGQEPLDIEKIHRVLEWATEDLSGVSVSDIEMKAQLQFFDGITTSEIHAITVAAAEDLITEQSPNYQYVASRLMIYDLRKKVFGSYEPIRLFEIVKKNVELGMYDPELLNWYTEAEWVKLGSYIKHDRDYKLTAAGVKQIIEKYLVQDRKTNTYFDTPQVAFMVLAAVGFHKYPQRKRLQYVREFYDALSKHEISLPTPILAGLRTPIRQFSSCVVIDIDDSLESITDATKLMVKYASKRAGLGINGGRIRAEGTKVGHGEVVHTGVTPYYRMFESAVKSCSQGGVRDACLEKHSYVETLDHVKVDGVEYPLNGVIEVDGKVVLVKELVNTALNDPTLTVTKTCLHVDSAETPLSSSQNT